LFAGVNYNNVTYGSTNGRLQSGIVPLARQAQFSSLVKLRNLGAADSDGVHTLSYSMTLSTAPLAGAVWLTPSVKVIGAANENLLLHPPVVTPSTVVFYAGDWNETKTVRVTLQLRSRPFCRPRHDPPSPCPLHRPIC